MKTPEPSRIQQLASCFALAADDMRDNLGPKNFSRGTWTGGSKLKKKMLSYGRGVSPRLTPSEVDWFVRQTPYQIAESFKQD